MVRDSRDGTTPKQSSQPAADGPPSLADPGYDGAGTGVLTPDLQRPAARPAVPGRAWLCLAHPPLAREPQYITAGGSRIGDIANAALVLTHFEHGHIGWKVGDTTSLSRSPAVPFDAPASLQGW